MIVFLSSLATLVAIGLVARLAQRDGTVLDDVTGFRIAE